jgi:DNA modification methylase
VGASTPDRDAVLPLPEYGQPGLNGAALKDPAFTENRAEPIHRWVPWIAGFSAGFVRDCLREYLADVEPGRALVLDPFAGVGTTLVEAFRRGYNTLGFEINPWAALAARAKLEAAEVSLAELDGWVNAFEAFMRETAGRGATPDSSLAPPGFRSRIPFFSPQVEPQVLWALAFSQSMGDPKIRDLFLVAFGSVMVKFSNYTYEPSLTSRPGCGKPLVEVADVGAMVAARLQEMAADCRALQAELAVRQPHTDHTHTPIPPHTHTANTIQLNRGALPDGSHARRERRVIQDSIFDAENHLEAASVDLAVTSPPYLNNYHYVRNTRPQLFWLEFIEKSTELRRIEEASFGKFWQTVRDGERLDLEFRLPELEATLEGLRGRNVEKGAYGGPGWSNYAAQYFNDTDRFCQVMARLLKPGARMVVVIGNSILQGIEIKVEEFLAQIAERHGLRREAVHVLRTKRVGNSIIRSAVRNAAAPAASLYEVAVVLRKPGGLRTTGPSTACGR